MFVILVLSTESIILIYKNIFTLDSLRPLFFNGSWGDIADRAMETSFDKNQCIFYRINNPTVWGLEAIIQDKIK